MQIRKGTIDDVAKVAELYDVLHDYLETHINYPGWKKEVYPTAEDAAKGCAEGTLFVAVSDGRIAGTMILNHEPEQGYEQAEWEADSDYSRILVVHTLAVHPQFMRHGVGRQMLNYALEYAEQNNMKAVRLDVYEKNVPAIKLYEEAGFRYIDTVDLGYGEYGLTWFRLYEKVVDSLEDMKFNNIYFINGTAYAGKSTLVKLLAQKYDGIACEENYHDALIQDLDNKEFPCLTYTRDLENWSEFVRRTPDEYEAWINGCTHECTILELKILRELSEQNKKVFVDTNIPVEVLREISDEDHVLIMLADPNISVYRFFDRPDKEKQFLYQLLLKEENPDQAIENFRECLKRINSKENYDKFLHSGFHVILRDENRTMEETLLLAEERFKLK